MSLGTLPDEILVLVTSYLVAREARALDHTCRELRGRVRRLVLEIRSGRETVAVGYVEDCRSKFI